MNDEHGCSPDLQSLRGKSIYQSAKEQSRKPEPQPDHRGWAARPRMGYN